MCEGKAENSEAADLRTAGIPIQIGLVLGEMQEYLDMYGAWVVVQ